MFGIITKWNKMLLRYARDYREDKELRNSSFTFFLFMAIISAFLAISFTNIGNSQAASMSMIFCVLSFVYVIVHYMDTMQDVYKWKGNLANTVGFGTKDKILFSIGLGFILGFFVIISKFLPMSNVLFSNLVTKVSLSSFVFVAILAPIVEEGFFRGFLMPTFVQITKNMKFGVILSIIALSALFSFMHYTAYGMTTDQLWMPFVFSILAILIMYTTKSLAGPIVLHFLFNLSYFVGIGII